MANLQIKGIDNAIYEELKKLAAAENRSISQQALFLIKDYLAKKQRVRDAENARASPLRSRRIMGGAGECRRDYRQD